MSLNTRYLRQRRVVRAGLVLRGLIGLTLVLAMLGTGPVRSARGDDSQIVTPEATVESVTVLPTATIAPVEPTTAQPEATVEVVEPVPTQTVAIEPTVQVDDAVSTTEPNAEVTVTEIAALPTVEPTVQPTPRITYSPAAQPECKPVPGSAESVASGGYLDYECRFAVTFSGEYLTNAEFDLDWTIAANAEKWTVQFKAPPSDEVPDPTWSDREVTPVRMTHTTRATVSEGAESRKTLRFLMRVHRPACAMEVDPIFLTADAVVSAPGVLTDRKDPLPLEKPFRVSPVLAPVAEPAIAIGGALNFGSVAVDALGVRQQPAPQTLTITVSDLNQACGDWNLDLASTSLDGEDGTYVAAGTLVLVSVGDVLLDDEGCKLDGGCPVATIVTGPGAEPVVSITLGIALILPDQLPTTTFNSTLTATMTVRPSHSLSE